MQLLNYSFLLGQFTKKKVTEIDYEWVYMESIERLLSESSYQPQIPFDHMHNLRTFSRSCHIFSAYKYTYNIKQKHGKKNINCQRCQIIALTRVVGFHLLVDAATYWIMSNNHSTSMHFSRLLYRKFVRYWRSYNLLIHTCLVS